jgi:hypothetical protein
MLIEKYLLTDFTTTVDDGGDADTDDSNSVEVFDGNLYISGDLYERPQIGLEWRFSAADLVGALEVPVVLGSYTSDTLSMATGGFILQDSASQLGANWPHASPGSLFFISGFTDPDYNRTWVVDSFDGPNQITFVNPFLEYKPGETLGNMVTVSSASSVSSPDATIIVLTSPVPVIPPIPRTLLGSDVSILESLTYDQRLLYWEAHKILNMLLDNFTPKMRYQYQDSVLFKSYVEAMAEELAVNQLQIKQAILQLNFQEAVSIFLNLWTQVIGIKKLEGETDVEYKNRILGNLFIDKVSNNAIRKSSLIKYGFSSSINDSGTIVPNLTYANFYNKNIKAKLLSNFYELSVDGISQTNETLDRLYEDSMDLTSLGNIIMRVIQDVNQDLTDGPYLFGAIYFQHDALAEGAIDKSTDTNWGLGEVIYFDNQWDSYAGKLFGRNLYAEDFVTIARTN